MERISRKIKVVNGLTDYLSLKNSKVPLRKAG